jgi:outer membrane protein assembly factor BamA
MIMRIKIVLIICLFIFSATSLFSQQPETIQIGKIKISGDKITYQPVIYRELEFVEGEILTKEELGQKILKSKQNLMNRSLFNFVFIETNKHDDIIDINVRVIERWYIWPIPIIEYADRNINIWWETKDFTRLNFGIDLRIENFRGRMENLNLIAKGGYDQTYIGRWQIPYLTKHQVFGMGFEGGYLLNHEIAYDTKNNKYQYYKSSTSFARKISFATINLTFRPGFNYLHHLSLSFTNIQVDDSVLLLNPDYTYGGNKYGFISISYTYKHDFRDFKPYPLKGYYFDVNITKNGLGILTEDVNQMTLSFNFDHFINLYKRWNFAWGFRGKLTYANNFQPYFLSGGIGLNGFDIRGYELYLINGQNLAIIKSNLKFTIIPRTTFRIKWLKSERFNKVFYGLYANVFFDAGYADDNYFNEGNPLNNQLLWGSGLGIDFVTYYDVVIGFSYAINKQNQKGFFISLVAPI